MSTEEPKGVGGAPSAEARSGRGSQHLLSPPERKKTASCVDAADLPTSPLGLTEQGEKELEWVTEEQEAIHSTASNGG